MLLTLLAVALLNVDHAGISLSVESESKQVDPARSVFLTVRLQTPRGVTAAPPDLRDRVRGFSLAEDFAEEPVTSGDGSVTQVVNWKLVTEPCAETYRIAPFAVTAKKVNAPDVSFVGGPIYFDAPAAREPVTGEMEVEPVKDLPPLSWKLVGQVALWLLAGLAVATGVVFAVRFLARRVREHRMSPIERAWVELDRLLKKGLPGRGRYKDFYVELTMVVRRYVQRKYGIKAPHLTTEEFLREIGAGASIGCASDAEALRRFLESADMVKFAGVEATPEMADAATESARGYLQSDAATPVQPKP